MKYWSGDKPLERNRDLLREKPLAESNVLDRDDQEAIIRLLTHIMRNGKRLSDKEEYEWRTCGILKAGRYNGKQRECIDLFWLNDAKGEDDHDADWALALLLKERRIRCAPDINGKTFLFHTNESYEEYIEQKRRSKRE